MPWYDEGFPLLESDRKCFEDTMEFWRDRWLLQGLANIPSVACAPSIGVLSFPGMPAVIIAPGPSLDRNIAQLPALKGKAVLIASSHALIACQRAGVTPDLVVVLDAQDLAYHFEGCDLSEATLVLSASAHPSLFALPARRIVTFAGGRDVDDWVASILGDRGALPSGGSVSGSALSMAIEWGCDPIVFVGQDLSFAGGQYYARSGIDADIVMELGEAGFCPKAPPDAAERLRVSFGGFTEPGQELHMLPGYYGGEVPTSFVFALLHRWLGHVASRLPGRCINATEGGAAIAGMAHVPLAHVRFPSAEVDVAAVIDAAYDELDVPMRASRVRSALQDALTCCDLTVEAAQDALDGLEAIVPAVQKDLEDTLVRTVQPIARQVELLQYDGLKANRIAARELPPGSSDLPSVAREFYELLEAGATLLRGAFEDVLVALRPAS